MAQSYTNRSSPILSSIRLVLWVLDKDIFNREKYLITYIKTPVFFYLLNDYKKVFLFWEKILLLYQSTASANAMLMPAGVSYIFNLYICRCIKLNLKKLN
jgi:hypothetical protein